MKVNIRCVTAVVAYYDSDGHGGITDAAVYQFEHAPGVDVEQAIRDTVEDFFASDPETAARAREDHDFNYGDATTWIDDEIWERHGLIHLDGIHNSTIVVEHDEDLTPLSLR